MKKGLQYTFKSLLMLIGLIVVYVSAAFVLSSLSISKEKETKDEVSIYILTNGVHTDIVVPTKNELYDWETLFPIKNVAEQDTNYNFLALGWGDKGFYLETPTWADLKVSTALKAAFGLSNTAIHATYYKKIRQGENCKRIAISKTQYLRLVSFIKETLVTSENGQSHHIVTNANYGKTDAFYDAKGKYSLFNTCNTWANNALKNAGQKCCVWTPMDKSIFAKYE
jgi:uncharacterized protein (TIGR02117 family)